MPSAEGARHLARGSGVSASSPGGFKLLFSKVI